jgi:hypothetical protein
VLDAGQRAVHRALGGGANGEATRADDDGGDHDGHAITISLIISD